MDGDGRLATLDLTLTVNARPVTTHTRFSDYGAAVTATKPAAASVVEAPDSFYRVFNH
jgi:hypothetical protein